MNRGAGGDRGGKVRHRRKGRKQAIGTINNVAPRAGGKTRASTAANLNSRAQENIGDTGKPRARDARESKIHQMMM